MKRLISFILILSFCLCFTSCTKITPIESLEKIVTNMDVSDFVDDNGVYAKISKFYTYGTHFNIYGTIEIASGISTPESFVLVLKNDKEEIEIETKTSLESITKLVFSTGEEINSGLNLEDIDASDYFLLIKDNNTNKYYSLSKDKVEDYYLSNITYYTLTKNNSNKKIDIGFVDDSAIPSFVFSIDKIKSLPDDVYDIVIDPGHGGIDSGAISNDGSVDERTINLTHALALKSEFEALGLKVYLTRDSDAKTDEDTVHNIFDDNGKITLANETKAKFYFAIHMNSSETKNQYKGFEIYIAPNANTDLANAFSNGIVNTAGASISNMTLYSVGNGVSKRGFTDSEIKDLSNTASKLGFTMYENITNDTPYYYFIRDIAGFITNSYTDGRNPKYGANKYMNSNQGIEGYLFELAYINNDEELEFIKQNYKLYAKGIAQGFKSVYF